MRRREFIAVVGGAAAAWPCVARVQQSTTPVIGYVSTGGRATTDEPLTAFRGGLQELGFIEGKTLSLIFARRTGVWNVCRN